MGFSIRAACVCDIGKIRKNNEDNFLFNKTILNIDHHSMGSPLTYKSWWHCSSFFAVFDGMGGEACGEAASYVAAKCTKIMWARSHRKIPDPIDFLNHLFQEVNLAVFRKSEEMHVSRMGSTMAMLWIKGKCACVGNLGDSKVFRLRDGTLEQLSVDHTDAQELKKWGIDRKPRLTQHLGIDPDEMRIEPYVASFPIKRKDYYLVCSDGLTDMLSEDEIQRTITDSRNVVDCTEQLLQKALDNGGKDNITVIVCKVL